MLADTVILFWNHFHKGILFGRNADYHSAKAKIHLTAYGCSCSIIIQSWTVFINPQMSYDYRITDNGQGQVDGVFQHAFQHAL